MRHESAIGGVRAFLSHPPGTVRRGGLIEEINMAETEVAASTAPNAGIRKGLPLLSLAEVEVAALKIWGAARRGSIPRAAAATALGLKSATSGGWDKWIAGLRIFHLI